MRKLIFALTFVALVGLLFGLSTQTAAAQTSDPTEPVVPVYFFWGNGCPHCAALEPYLESLAEKYPQVEIRDYEVWYDENNQQLLTQMAAKYGFEVGGVPTTFIGEKYLTGYDESVNEAIEAAIVECLDGSCIDPGAGIITPAQDQPFTPTQITPIDPDDPESGQAFRLPLIGTVNLENQSLAISTLLIAFVDGFNPCSLWALSMLLALTLHTGDRKKVLIIGLVFILVTGGIYALFIAGLFTVLKVVSFMGWIQVVVALVALFFAAVNIKDYFWYKEGISFTIADDDKTSLARRMRRVTAAGQSFWGLVGGTIVLAAGVSLVEFSCTAGFPVLWTNLVSAQQVTVLSFILLLLLYMVIYQLDELGIFLVAVTTLKASRLEEKQGRILKLIGGMLMLTLALVMLINPTLMNSLGSSLLIFGGAFAAAGLVLLVHRAILPSFGIWIGSEGKPKSRKVVKKRKSARQ